MATKHNAPYKKLQRKAKAHMKFKGYPLWTADEIVDDGFFISLSVRRQVQGTYKRSVHGKLGS